MAGVIFYIQRIKQRDPELNKGWGQIATPLLIETKGGKQKVNCANAKGIFRIIQSIPSKNAEPFKLWLAQVGKERLDEIQNPELAMDRMRELYRKKGYPEEWIEKRARGIAVRHTLTDEWEQRGAKQCTRRCLGKFLKINFSFFSFGFPNGTFRINTLFLLK